MPVHNRCNEIKNRSFICNHACSRGHGIEDTLQLHKARTKAHASSMPVHNRCNEIKNKAQNLLGATHAAEATTQETHCNCTRHVPRRVPRPCPCTIGVMKSRTDYLSALTHAAEATAHETHCVGRAFPSTPFLCSTRSHWSSLFIGDVVPSSALARVPTCFLTETVRQVEATDRHNRRGGITRTRDKEHTRTVLQNAANFPKVVFTTNNQMIQQCIVSSVPVQRD